MPATTLLTHPLAPVTDVRASPLVRSRIRGVADVVLATPVERRCGACPGTLPVGGRTTRAIVERAVVV